MFGMGPAEIAFVVVVVVVLLGSMMPPIAPAGLSTALAQSVASIALGAALAYWQNG